MKKLSKEISAYKYNELSETAKETVKQWHLTDESRTMFFSEDVISTLNENFGLFNLKTYYSLSSCQGDGLCLYGKITHSELFRNEKFKKIALKNIHYKQIEMIFNELEGIDFIHNGRYYYANSVNIESHDYDPTEKQTAVIDNIINNVKAWYFSFCKEWEERGYDHFYEISDNEMDDFCAANDYLFTGDGKFICLDEYKEIA
jgi:hypothetical protein